MTYPAQYKALPLTCPDCGMVFTSNASVLAHLRKAHKAGVGRNKFHAEKVELDGFTFGSGDEARRYTELLLLQRAGEIRALQVHPVYHFWVRGILVGHYTPDFEYQTAVGSELIVEDVKGGKATRTEAYGLRKRLLWACLGIRVKEVEV